MNVDHRDLVTRLAAALGQTFTSEQTNAITLLFDSTWRAGFSVATADCISLVGQIMHALGKERLDITAQQRSTCPPYFVSVHQGGPFTPIRIEVELPEDNHSYRVH